MHNKMQIVTMLSSDYVLLHPGWEAYQAFSDLNSHRKLKQSSLGLKLEKQCLSRRSNGNDLFSSLQPAGLSRTGANLAAELHWRGPDLLCALCEEAKLLFWWDSHHYQSADLEPRLSFCTVSHPRANHSAMLVLTLTSFILLCNVVETIFNLDVQQPASFRSGSTVDLIEACKIITNTWMSITGVGILMNTNDAVLLALWHVHNI